MARNDRRSPSSPAAASSNSEPPTRSRRDAGFSLAEVLVAMLVMVSGLLGVAQLLVVAIDAESKARNGAMAYRLGQGKLDDLMKASFDTSPQIQVTATGVDTLAANVANYFDTPDAGVTRRWRVQQGPADTRLVTVRVVVARALKGRRTVDLTTLVRRW